MIISFNKIKSGGGGGTTDYNQLQNKPSINNVVLQGNKSFGDLGIDTSISGSSTDNNVPSSLSVKTYVENYFVRKREDVTFGGTSVTLEIKGNVDYTLSSLVTSLTINLDSDYEYTKMYEANIYFTTGDSITVDIPNTIKTVGVVEFSPNTSYVISIVNNIMVVGECVSHSGENDRITYKQIEPVFYDIQEPVEEV